MEFEYLLIGLLISHVCVALFNTISINGNCGVRFFEMSAMSDQETAGETAGSGSLKCPQCRIKRQNREVGLKAHS